LWNGLHGRRGYGSRRRCGGRARAAREDCGGEQPECESRQWSSPSGGARLRNAPSTLQFLASFSERRP
jgi:hypothetical protein